MSKHRCLHLELLVQNDELCKELSTCLPRLTNLEEDSLMWYTYEFGRRGETGVRIKGPNFSFSKYVPSRYTCIRENLHSNLKSVNMNSMSDKQLSWCCFWIIFCLSWFGNVCKPLSSW